MIRASERKLCKHAKNLLDTVFHVWRLTRPSAVMEVTQSQRTKDRSHQRSYQHGAPQRSGCRSSSDGWDPSLFVIGAMTSSSLIHERNRWAFLLCRSEKWEMRDKYGSDRQGGSWRAGETRNYIRKKTQNDHIKAHQRSNGLTTETGQTGSNKSELN